MSNKHTTNEPQARTRTPGATLARDHVKSLADCKGYDPAMPVSLAAGVPASEGEATGPRNVARKAYKADAPAAEQSNAWHMWRGVHRALRKAGGSMAIGDLGEALQRYMQRQRNADGTPRTVPANYTIGGEVDVLAQRGVVVLGQPEGDTPDASDAE